MAGWSEALSWDAGPMEAEAETNRGHAATLDDVHASVLALRPPVWFGTAADRSRQDLRLMLARLAAITDLLSRQAALVSGAAADLRRLQIDQKAVLDDAISKQFRIEPSGWVISTAQLPASLDPRRAWWWIDLNGAVLSIVWRVNSLDVSLALGIGGLTVDDLLDGLQQAAISWTNSAFADAQDALASANQWLVDAAEQHWPAASAALQAWQRGSESFMGEAARQPRWLQELLYTGKLPAAAELLGQGLFLGLHAVGDATGSTFFDDGSPYVPTFREAIQTQAPSSVADLVSNMERPYSTSSDDDTTDRPAVEISIIEGNPPRFIVNIPGTTLPLGRIEGWNGDVEGTDWPADLKAIGYGDSAVTQSTKAAIDLAIRNYESAHGPVDRPNVLLTGHSQGGIIAANIASDPAFTARYQVDGIITAGSPINTIAINQDIAVVNFHHTNDIVPKLDLGGAHPQPGVTEIELPREGGLAESHEVANYATDVATRTAQDPRIQNLDAALAPYLSNQADLVTYRYDIGRQ